MDDICTVNIFKGRSEKWILLKNHQHLRHQNSRELTRKLWTLCQQSMQQSHERNWIIRCCLHIYNYTEMWYKKHNQRANLFSWIATVKHDTWIEFTCIHIFKTQLWLLINNKWKRSLVLIIIGTKFESNLFYRSLWENSFLICKNLLEIKQIQLSGLVRVISRNKHYQYFQ